jgi:hypothetical protein
VLGLDLDSDFASDGKQFLQQAPWVHGPSLRRDGRFVCPVLAPALL